jgi:hypothetical protein
VETTFRASSSYWLLVHRCYHSPLPRKPALSRRCRKTPRSACLLGNPGRRSHRARKGRGNRKSAGTSDNERSSCGIWEERLETHSTRRLPDEHATAQWNRWSTLLCTYAFPFRRPHKQYRFLSRIGYLVHCSPHHDYSRISLRRQLGAQNIHSLRRSDDGCNDDHHGLTLRFRKRACLVWCRPMGGNRPDLYIRCKLLWHLGGRFQGLCLGDPTIEDKSRCSEFGPVCELGMTPSFVS